MIMNKKKPASLHEATLNLWKIRIILEKNYTENCAAWMAGRIESLIDYHKQDGTFKLVKATLIPYQKAFEKEYDITRIAGTVIYWDIELQEWRTFQLENFLEWRPIC